MKDSTAQYKYAPAEYFTSLIGHEGPESLLHEIKRQGLGTALLTKTDRLAKGLSFFNRYRRKRPKVDASIFDSALSHTRLLNASEKREEKSVSTFGRFGLWTSFESSPVSVE